VEDRVYWPVEDRVYWPVGDRVYRAVENTVYWLNFNLNHSVFVMDKIRECSAQCVVLCRKHYCHL
jgi:hypothetical protein